MSLSPTDRMMLHDLVHRYAADVDQRNFAAVAGLFVSDAVLTMPEPPDTLDAVTEHAGPTAIQTALSALDEVPLTTHEILGAVFDPGATSQRATGRIVCAAHHLSSRDGRTKDLVWHLRYQDHYTQIDGQWRFVSRAAHIDFIETRDPRRARLD